MMRTILLDAGPMGMLCSPPRHKGLSADCKDWLKGLIRRNVRIIVPEITDYEVRRELIRTIRSQSIQRLDKLGTDLEYLPLSTAAIRKAAELWAKARQAGRPTASDQSIDADAILAAQALSLGEPDYVIATTNVGHLSYYATAQVWYSITAP